MCVFSCFRSVALKFGVARSAAWESTHRVVDALLLVNGDKHVVEWPTGQKAVDVIAAFRRISNFPGKLNE